MPNEDNISHPFDQEASEGLAMRSKHDLHRDISELNAGILEKARERAMSTKPHSTRPYYWAAAAGVAILAGLTILLLFQFHPASNIEHGTRNKEHQITVKDENSNSQTSVPNDMQKPVATTKEEATALNKEISQQSAVSSLEPGTRNLEPGTRNPEPEIRNPHLESANEIYPPDTNKVEEESIFLIVETMPEFPGGEEALNRYIADSLRYPAAAIEMAIQGRVFVTFVVEKDGSVSNARIRRGIGGGCDEEALRVIRSMPKWAPGKQSGQPVRVQYNMPIKFTLSP